VSARWRYRRMVRVCLGARPFTALDHLVGVLAVLAAVVAVLVLAKATGAAWAVAFAATLGVPL